MMTVTFTFDPAVRADVDAARSMLDRLTDGHNDDGIHDDDTELFPKIVDDLLRRVGGAGRELLILASQFDEPFSLPDLAEKTGETVSKMKSRWANLGRSIAKTRGLFGNIEIFKEQMPSPNSNGYFTFRMHEGIREALLQATKRK